MTAMTIWIFNFILWLIVGVIKIKTKDMDKDFALCLGSYFLCLICLILK